MKPVFALPLAAVLVSASVAYSQQATLSDAKPATTTVPAPAGTTAPTGTTEEIARPAVPNTLMDGTAVSLRLAETISSADAHTGQQVPFEVTQDVVVQGVTVLPKGSPALATVTDAEPKKRMGRGGKLDVNIDSARLADGSKIQLRATKNTKGGGHTGAMTGAMVATGIVFFPAAPLFLFMHGKDITIPKGTEVTAFVQGDTKLDMARLQNPAGAAAPATASTAAATATMASLQVDSSVTGADIEVDDAFMGNTPSALSVTPGMHTITVKKKGYTPWTRKMTVAGTSVHLNAELEPLK